MPDFISSVWKDNLFAGKVVFCTGGNGSICSGQVRALVHLGANACIVGRNTEKTERVAKDIASVRSGSKVLGIGGVDVRSVESLQKSIDTCVNELGGIDFLIAGAAGNFLAPISQLSPNAFKSVMDIDVMGSYNVTKLALPHLVASAKKHNSTSTLPKSPSTGPGGRIIYVSATIHYTGLPLQTHVAVAKAGVDALSANVAIEYGPLGLTSNIIAPGPISGTEGMDRLSKKHFSGDSPGKKIPVGRWGLVKEIADATVYLFSDAANYVTGDKLVVDGGSWHTSSGSPGGDFEYPDFLLSGAEVTGVGGSKKKQASSKL
ncbi:peroxisomal 2 4-dienoyl-CoA reductase sps19 [Elasticomyces elasticus]|uniref:2,4-dienoyl-CoA reductase [(3E)-enoyl-CoA-producing] n=1 Tax=Exophiala sideris TaxID=1016849 RepID=A0ABR0JNB0_9EURO|nr:peroxisomal 2 4-dienoyl-CoA reductase sps19 [Elasticomyces elasticus]KAK5037983.1 peroxisomal 2 4-dienoyl-CoA reductase sps19 [Exophiala sideris]KAK5043965.1 peroxisomal 2 4-dienoyl-CoA reductase sps19 [Exophiala sideris]KAK5067464.1 peroxisomal 2 4-dienoyl-CoA reductase sps19 [Exophiala sideris]KAK5184300.1 peroxisomal 2 4-dienoyl-CoA reductase sps19 [Eurotiomycetes sp. CCFEE 6388]